jgi:hypothetical protein
MMLFAGPIRKCVSWPGFESLTGCGNEVLGACIGKEVNPFLGIKFGTSKVLGKVIVIDVLTVVL